MCDLRNRSTSARRRSSSMNACLISLDPETMIEGLLRVDPESEPVDEAKRQKARDRAGDEVR